MSFTSVMTLAAMAVAAIAGSILTALAVVEGNPTATFVRFTASIGLGAYYAYLHHLAEGGRLAGHR